MSGERFDHLEVKRRVQFLDLLAYEGIAMRKSGPHRVGRCPFHEERSGSFTVHAPASDHGHCYGCGWNGDIFDFWRERHGVGFSESVAALASLASVSPIEFEVRRKEAAKMSKVTAVSDGDAEKPALPRMRPLNEEEIAGLAKLRHLSVAGIAAAAELKRVGACMWPQYQDRHGCWCVADDASACWVVTDSARRVAQFRRLDGGKFRRKDGKEIKAWTKGSPTWPLGAGELAGKPAVLMVEGGADMLAAYHFLALFGRLHRVGVCAMLGASMKIAADAVALFRRKRVRIMMDEDEARDERGIRPGCEAAARWTGQLVAAGAAVETFSLAGLTQRDGSPVKDLNDLALVAEGAWVDPELRQAFFDFDF